MARPRLESPPLRELDFPLQICCEGWGHPAILVSAHRGEGEGLEEIRSGPSYLPGLSSQGRAVAERF